METGFYLHIPFCVRKCIYCDFYSLETGTGSIGQRLRNALPDHTDFLDALEIEIRALPSGFSPTTVFIGGGTPTELSDNDLHRLLEMIRKHVDLQSVHEWTCEVNPGTLTAHKSDILKTMGVNRISLGAQSFDVENLSFLGRIHSPDDVPRAYEILRQTGFNNINIDLIYGIPGSNEQKALKDIRTVIELQPEHASCYALTFEEGTPLMDMKRKGHVKEAVDHTVISQYRLIKGALKKARYAQYEISNFAQQERACRHNLLYWTGGAYIGCGPSAHSHWEGRRYANVRDLYKYCNRMQAEGHATDFEEVLPPSAKARETLIMWLRRTEGVPLNQFERLTSFKIEDLYGDTLDQLIGEGLLKRNSQYLRLTENGTLVSDRVFAELV